MYKDLFAEVFLANPIATDNYKLDELFNFTTENLLAGIKSSDAVMTYNKVFEEPYLKNLNYLKNTGLPNSKDEQFNFANLHKLYSIEHTPRIHRNAVHEEFSWVAEKNNELVLVDGTVLASNNLHGSNPSLRILDTVIGNTSKQKEYIKYIKETTNFTNTTYAFSPFVNVMIFPTGSKQSYHKNPLVVNYLNNNSVGSLNANTTIFDIQHNVSAKIKEKVTTTAGQMNYSIYILREGSKLEIDRTTKDAGGWSLFDSVFICHPNSELKIKSTNTGSQYTQENLYIHSSSNNKVEVIGRNNIHKGNDYHQFIHQISNDVDNYSSIDVKNVGNEYANTSFIGRYDVGALSTNFDGIMNNQNLMLSKNTKMHTRPILDIKTKEIQCQHGCTVSNIDEQQKYYLQSRGVDNINEILVESFLC